MAHLANCKYCGCTVCNAYVCNHCLAGVERYASEGMDVNNVDIIEKIADRTRRIRWEETENWFKDRIRIARNCDVASNARFG